MTRTAKLHDLNRGDQDNQANRREAWAGRLCHMLTAGVSIPRRRGD